MTAPRRGRLRVVLGAFAMLLGFAGVLLWATAPEPESVAAEPASVLRVVRTLEVQPLAVRDRVRLDGLLLPDRDVRLVSETEGRVIATGAQALDAVAAEQVLLEVDPLLARVGVERARASKARSESQLRLAESNLERRRSLAGRDVVSASLLDESENAARVARADLRDARAALEEALDRLDKKTLRAPFAGVLRAFDLDVGDTVQRGQFLGELVDASRIRIEVGLSDREIVAVEAGQAARLEVEAWPGEIFPGRVERVARAADTRTKKFPVEVTLPNEDGRLLPGMVGSVTLELGDPVRRTSVPRDATFDEFGLRVVWVIEPDGNGAWVARRRRVSVREIPFRPGEFEVLSGLAAGERIAITGIRQLRDGERVERKQGSGS